jgi:hypothetical protein
VSDTTDDAQKPLFEPAIRPMDWVSPDRRFCIEQANRLLCEGSVEELLVAAKKIEAYLTRGE